ncbi:glycosyltransferase family 4 protein [Demequina oxidasica]|uniref:glycosyltransferase family 4 protein n=1 Tax=Demequina oxidasica TaxID=676199 RepID=UPI000782764B|nr:glycosyltransferase family 4 protein [Demequina oxidasica]
MTDSLKIALVLDDSIDRPDGVQQYALTLGGYLERAGHTVHYVCSEASRDDVTVHSLARNMAVTFNGNGLRVPLPTSRKALREFLERERYDVIHVQTPHSPLFAARVVDEARRVQARTVRIVGTFHILPDGRVSSIGTHALGKVLRCNLRKFDDFAAVSAPAAEFAREAFGIECTVIPNAVDVAAVAGAVREPRPVRGPGDRLVVAFLGRLVERKGALELVQALGALPGETVRRLDVRIGGKGPLLGDLEAAIESQGLGGVVRLEGFVSEEDKPQFYADADLAVFPATGGESFGIVLIEAMASGSGVVMGGDNPGYRSVLGERPQVTVDARDAGAFAAVLQEVLSDAALRDEIHDEQVELLKAYDINVTGAAMLELYKGH